MKLKNLFKLFVLLWAIFCSQAQAALNVFACEPEWGALAKEIGGSFVNVFVATNALQDPHQIQAKPNLIAKMRNADILLCTGAELEIGWLPILLQQSGNSKIQIGQTGYFAAADYVRKLDIPNQLDRSQGDVHAAGNPHIQTDPRNIAQVAIMLAERLEQIDPTHANEYKQRQQDFQQRWQQALMQWQKKAAPLKGMAVVSQHKAFVYLYDWLGFKEIAVLEPKPGIEPTPAHLQKVLAKLQNTPARIVVHAAYQDSRPSEWLVKNTVNGAIKPAKLPFTVGGTEAASNLFTLFDDTIARLLNAAGISQ